MLTFAIGDIHGCQDKLIKLLDECRRYANGIPTKYIFLGDLIDRGPDSRAVVQTVMDLQAHDPENVIALTGNHEELLRASDTSHGLRQWLANGGSEALGS
ncbi:serine/threonine protein phosphatase [Pseudolabrys taiwanensis]|uniref:Serine/threonine protein phosphatase n=1 Tax=Pseudolabrys taiwanensis TaxID=331696 RepID=A0A345ZZC3_9HYPH|nr:metallophosphoesterase [Pseudolabrys taiwanensis]AXK82270.1 serine/threonine protein phosphatase [Pseudolabrys taiwanensis]